MAAVRAVSRASSVSMTCDASRWNDSVERLGGRLLQTWNWGEFKSLHGWSVDRIAAPVDGQPRAVAQLLFRAVGPFSVGYIPRGPLVGEVSAAEVAEFARAIDDACRRRRAIAILVEPETAESPL